MSGMFGPQTANAVTSKPNNTAVQRYGGRQTWFKDCSGPGASDGTVPDAAFYNRIVGALDYIIGASGASGVAGDDSFLYRAILQMVSQDAPDALNSLRELALAIQNDPNFAGTVMTMLANRLRFDQAQFLNSTQKAQAVANLGLAAVAVSGAYSSLSGLPALFSGNYADLSGKPTLGTAAALDVGTGANQVVQLTAAGKYPAVDGSLITGFATVARTGAYADLTGKPTLGTAAALNVGTSANQIVQLDAGAKLPAVDGSQLTGLSGSFAPTRVRVDLAADVNLTTNAYTDGPSAAVGTGTHLVIGKVTLMDTLAAAAFNIKLWDGTTLIDSAQVNTPAANVPVVTTLHGFITNPSGNVRMTVSDGNGTPSGRIKASLSGLGKDSTISVVRVA